MRKYWLPVGLLIASGMCVQVFSFQDSRPARAVSPTRKTARAMNQNGQVRVDVVETHNANPAALTPAQSAEPPVAVQGEIHAVSPIAGFGQPIGNDVLYRRFTTASPEDLERLNRLRALTVKLQSEDLDDKERDQVREKLRTELTEQFDEDVKRREEEIAQIEKKLAKLKETVKKRAALRDELIGLKVKLIENEMDGLGSSSWLQSGWERLQYAPAFPQGTPGAAAGVYRNPVGRYVPGTQWLPNALPPNAPNVSDPAQPIPPMPPEVEKLPGSLPELPDRNVGVPYIPSKFEEGVPVDVPVDRVKEVEGIPGEGR